ncbi:hypothetical protein B0H10DRAFT_1986740 [Mycena sp. CBHHK59/15]|nr:hypothetical protein B0H10DRAFT_1986740 [Mycena sp. CBHHK59/15]
MSTLSHFFISTISTHSPDVGAIHPISQISPLTRCTPLIRPAPPPFYSRIPLLLSYSIFSPIYHLPSPNTPFFCPPFLLPRRALIVRFSLPPCPPSQHPVFLAFSTLPIAHRHLPIHIHLDFTFLST